MEASTSEIIRASTRKAASEQAAVQLVNELEKLLADDSKRPVSIAWCGGTSPAELFPGFVKNFSRLSELDRARVHFILIDERRVPLTDEQSNFRMLSEKLFSVLLEAKLISEKQIHAFPVELEPELAAREYSRLVLEVLGGIDIVILGVGPDGHVAAVFPQHSSIQESGKKYLFVSDRPKPPKEGFSASVELLQSCRVGFLLFFGSEKGKPLSSYLSGTDEKEVPARVGRAMKRSFVVTDIQP